MVCSKTDFFGQMIMTDLKYPKPQSLETPQILKELIPAHKHLAELKGIIRSIPNEKILLSNLTLQEAKDSSAIENIITTQDSLYKHNAVPDLKNKPNKEIYHYREALEFGYEKVKVDQGISLNTILNIQKIIESNKPGFRRIPGTVIKNVSENKVVYTPPSPDKLSKLMEELEKFINTDSSMDPIIKMAVIHHHFESIHPFYDGNGRTGRILNILYLVLMDLLNSPVLFLSRFIQNNRSDYYRLLQKVRTDNTWTEWIIYILKSVSSTAQSTTNLIKKIDQLFKEYKHIIRSKHKFYSQDLLNSIFFHPYTKVKFLQQDIRVSRATATRYLDDLYKSNILEKHTQGKNIYYVNTKLFELLKKS